MKKPLYKRWYVLVGAFVVLCCIVAPFLPKSEPSISVPVAGESASTIESQAETPPFNSNLDTNYNGPYYELLYENDYSTGDINSKIFEIYSEIDLSDDDWQSKVKSVISHFNVQQETYADVMYRVFNTRDNRHRGQMSLIAIWKNSPESTIIFYPTGGGLYAETESEYWMP